jgi:hypothetical protein
MWTCESSVQHGWLARLPADRLQVFDNLSCGWEHGYAMLSVALDQAIALREDGRLVQARRQAAVAGALAARLADHLAHSFAALQRAGFLRGRLPEVESLCRRNFRGGQARRVATWNAVAGWVPLGLRVRFVLKLLALRGALKETSREFCEVAREIEEGACIDPGAAWRALDALHYDLNTVMREAVVLLKSYLAAAGPQAFAALCSQLAAPAGAGLTPRPGFSRVST